MSAPSKSAIIRAKARAAGRHVSSFTEAFDSAIRASKPNRKPVAAQLEASKIVDVLNAQWLRQFEKEAEAARAAEPKPETVPRSAPPPYVRPADVVSSKGAVDCFGSVDRRAQQAVKDAAELAKIVRLPTGEQLVLRPIAIRVVARSHENGDDLQERTSRWFDGYYLDKARRKAARKLRRRRLAWWAR